MTDSIQAASKDPRSGLPIIGVVGAGIMGYIYSKDNKSTKKNNYTF